MADSTTEPQASAPVFKKRGAKGKANLRKRPATPPPADSDDSDYSSSEDESGQRVKRRKKTATVTASSKDLATGKTDLQATVYTADRNVPITSTNDATKHSNWYDEDSQDALSAKNLLGSTRTATKDSQPDGTYKGLANQTTFIQKNPDAPSRAKGPVKASSNVRTITIMDFKPDICKDYKKTGHCGFGDSCIYLHDRTDVKQGWQLDKEWEEVTRGKKNLGGTIIASANRDKKEEKAEDEAEIAMLEKIPFAFNTLRDRYTPVSHKSTFRQTGQITPEEFLAAGDYLVYKFPTWSWGDADSPEQRVSHLPPGKQFLVTRNVPCHRRLNDDFAGDAGHEEALVNDGDDFKGATGDDEDGWLRTGGLASSQPLKVKEVRTVDDSGNVGDREVVEDDDEIPDMEDEDDDEAIIRDSSADSKNSAHRTYTLYIMYSPYYRTPRLYLSGYLASGQPLPPNDMTEDIVGDYKDKTVTLEDFPFFANNIKMASVHPCKHASVMKTLLDRADAALRLRREKLRAGNSQTPSGMEGLVDEIGKLDVKGAQEAADKDEWEEVQETEIDDQEVAIRVDQYLVVFLKFMASVTPGIEHDFTMGV
ncbi:hypothetical protein AU210_009669 [Fusarium oxysporum f. sp. radicis-cucumerinum]|uniref:Autophagy-related protein 3 n=3 Tax=Fusarium TaxID=5506 RepID=A0A2H3H6H8_FUSOX|nr:hypothetical protein AU210_009669 [Fusarium oxysporum f. sp. radicis-cucumerinum]